LTELKGKIIASEKDKKTLTNNLGKAAQALNAKSRNNAQALKAKEAELLGKIGECEKALAAAQEDGRQTMARVIEENQASSKSKTGRDDSSCPGQDG
jgi:uncharacterized protein YlxW (UPF0749 family)